MAPQTERPAFKQLPLGKGDPQFSAWGLWGKDDELGTLNLLSSTTVKAAASEIQTGERFSLKYIVTPSRQRTSLIVEKPNTTGFGRHCHALEHKLLVNPYVLALDDTLSFNTQRSSQWDGLRHFAYQKERLFYGGVTLSDITESDSGKLGQHEWHKAGGIVGRGILIDYWSWAIEQAKTYDATEPTPIRFDDLMACLRDQQRKSESPESVIPRKGDILFIRVGYSNKYAELSATEETERQTRMPPETCGIHQDVRMLEWFWDSQFAAVAGDAPGWGCFPPDSHAGYMYHEVLLAGWGCPIGETLWLEDLAERCKKSRRWTFFVSSVPLNVFGGVASPANLVAVL